MGWDKGRYYTRSKKVNGRVVREYVGRGPIGELAAEIDTLTRAQRQQQAEERKQSKAAMVALDAQIDELCDVADLLAEAALIAAGYRRHNRGEWRKKRVQRNDECASGPSLPAG